MSKEITVEDLQAMLEQPATKRRLIALAGPPASGKSTLAERLVDDLNAKTPSQAALLPMDGFHFDDTVLNARGHRARKGAPHTFDALAFLHTLRRLKDNTDAYVSAPVFDRSLEIAKAGAVVIEPDVQTIIVEGNYLLLDQDIWRDIAALFDHSVRLDVPEDELRRRLTDRWEGFDMSPAEIAEKLEGNDLPNARLVMSQSLTPDFVIRNV